MMPKNQKFLRPHRFEIIVARIERQMFRGKLSPGDRLPSERHLAAHLQVSRGSVREAIRVLEANGLVEIRRGRKGGAYVKAPVHRMSPGGPDSRLRLDRLCLDQITDFRLTIEGHVTGLAARAADSADIRQLKRRLESVRALMNRGSERVDAYIEADKDLHICVAQIAGNPLFAQALDAALALKPHFCPLLKRRPALMETNYKDLASIVCAIEGGRPEEASLATKRHITRFNDAIE